MSQSPSQASLSIILAAYSEVENLKSLLPEINSICQSLSPNYEIIVVDTQTPTDNAEEICRINSVRYLNRMNSNDYGDAIRTGIANSTGDYVVIMDSDGSHAPGFIQKLWEKRTEAEIIIASRYVPGGSTRNPWMLVLMSKTLNLLFNKLVKIPVLDVSNSFRLYRGEPLRKLQLNFRHFDIIEEILAKMLWEMTPPAKVIEIPFEFEERKSGRPKRNIVVFSYYFLLAIFRLNSIRRKLGKQGLSK
jgi:dolichol-phosphate mannosyltransferase